MAGHHHFVHLVMTLDTEAVRTRVNSGASPHHRIVSGKSRNTGEEAAQPAPVPPGMGSAPGRGAGQEGSPMAHHRFQPATLKNDPVMW